MDPLVAPFLKEKPSRILQKRTRASARFYINIQIHIISYYYFTTFNPAMSSYFYASFSIRFVFVQFFLYICHPVQKSFLDLVKQTKLFLLFRFLISIYRRNCRAGLDLPKSERYNKSAAGGCSCLSAAGLCPQRVRRRRLCLFLKKLCLF